MKRRNVDVGKMRRPLKRNKITDGFYGSTLLYLKFLVLWVLVILADFILEFRFEFLWPFYLLLRSVYDSFKYQGLAFSVLFVCVALTSDMLCYFFVPVHWLFFAASTYVWVQYVWYTDRGICAPTILLWLLFVYLEAAVRLRDVKHMPGHLDLCRPFAAHCIGYPVVTLGFGFKSYVGYRMRQRKQRDVAKENQFYQQLLLQALPVDAPSDEKPAGAGDPSSSTVAPAAHNGTRSHAPAKHPPVHEKNALHASNGVLSNGIHHGHQKSQRRSLDKSKEHIDHEHNARHLEKHAALDSGRHKPAAHLHVNGVPSGAGLDDFGEHSSEVRPSKRKEKREQDKDREEREYMQKMEVDVRRLKSELQSSRQNEQELRFQIAHFTTGEKVLKGDLTTLQRENEDLQSKLQTCSGARVVDRQTIVSLERRIAEERRLRSNCETQLAQERKSRKQEEVRAAQAAAQSSRGECTENCKVRRRELESEIGELRTTQRWTEDRIAALERENLSMAEQLRDTDILMSALSTLQDKNNHLENSLSAENRIKVDLFSALGEAKRQLEIRENANRAQEKEIEELKRKIAQVLAVMPNDTYATPPLPTGAVLPRVRLVESAHGSTLDPNATAYTPKGSLVTSTEA